MNVKARSRVHKTAVLALTFAVMAWMWGGSLVTADADSMRGEPAPVIGQDHPKDPGEVKLFKTAKAVDGMVNTWDITLRAEVKDNLKKSDIVLVGDRSGSMKDDERMKKAKDAAEKFVDSLLASQTEKGTTRIALVSFAEDARTDVELTSDASKLKGAIEKLEANGATFTQGGHQASQGDAGEIYSRLQAHRVAFRRRADEVLRAQEPNQGHGEEGHR
ncbi:vWA domain-containing protein [Trueperella pyogenes]